MVKNGRAQKLTSEEEDDFDSRIRKFYGSEKLILPALRFLAIALGHSKGHKPDAFLKSIKKAFQWYQNISLTLELQVRRDI